MKPKIPEVKNSEIKIKSVDSTASLLRNNPSLTKEQAFSQTPLVEEI